MTSALRASVAALVAVPMFLSAGCVMTDEVGGSNNAPPTTVGLVDQTAAVGESLMHGGVVFTVRDISSFDQSPDGVPRIAVMIRSENEATAARRNPDVRLSCAESDGTGDWYSGSTWEPNYLLPVNVVDEGVALVGFPKKPDGPQYPVASCSAARLVVTLGDPETTKTQRVFVDVPAAVISESLMRPRGPNLPLPLGSA